MKILQLIIALLVLLFGIAACTSFAAILGIGLLNVISPSPQMHALIDADICVLGVSVLSYIILVGIFHKTLKQTRLKKMERS